MTTAYNCDQLVNEALLGTRDFDGSRYMEAAMYLLRGLRDFQIFHSASVKQSWVKISGVKTISFPDDYLNFVSLGINVGGKIFTYSKSSKLVLPSDPLGYALNDVKQEGDFNVNVGYQYGSNGYNSEGYFALDPAHDRIVLKQEFIDLAATSTRTEILLSYVANGIDGDLKNSFVPGAAANMLIAFIEYKLVASMPEKYPANFRSDKYTEYVIEAEKFDLLALPSVEELYDAIYETSSQGIRR